MTTNNTNHTVIEMSTRDNPLPDNVFRPIPNHNMNGGPMTHDNIAPPTSMRNRRDATNNSEMSPLLEVTTKPVPPLAGPEIDDLEGDNSVPATPDNHPGIDDGFFHDEHDITIDGRFGGENDEHPGTEIKPKIDEKPEHGENDEGDGVHGHGGNYLDVPHPRSMHGSHTSIGGTNGHPRFRPDSPFPLTPEFSVGYHPTITPDVNVYQQKKNLAQGMMDLALLSANANQLRYVLEAGNFHPYYYPSLIFISASLILQILVGVGLILNSTYNVKEHDEICKADRINDLTIIGIFLITIVNVFIASFGVATAPHMSLDVDHKT